MSEVWILLDFEADVAQPGDGELFRRAHDDDEAIGHRASPFVFLLIVDTVEDIDDGDIGAFAATSGRNDIDTPSALTGGNAV